MLCKFIAVHLPHSTVERHHAEYGSKLRHHESYCSYKYHTVLIIMKTDIDNIGHNFCLLGIQCEIIFLV